MPETVNLNDIFGLVLLIGCLVLWGMGFHKGGQR